MNRRHHHGWHHHFEFDHRDRGPRGHGRGGFFDHFAGGGPGGFARMRAKLITSSDLQLIILVLLKEKPRHGYEVIKSLGEHSSGVYEPSPGMVYPALTYLEEAGLAASEADGNKKLFRITDEGEAHLAKNRTHADEALAGLARLGRKLAGVREQLAEDEETEETFGRGPEGRGDPRQSREEWRELKNEFREIKHELKVAIFEKLMAPMEEKRRVLEVLRRAIDEIREK